MSLLSCTSSRRTAARLRGFCVAFLALSVAIPSLAAHLGIASRNVNLLDFLRGFFIGLAITLLAMTALLSRRGRSAPSAH